MRIHRPSATAALALVLAALGALACSRAEEGEVATLARDGSAPVASHPAGEPARSVAGFGSSAAPQSAPPRADREMKAAVRDAAGESTAPGQPSPSLAQLPGATVTAPVDSGAAPMIIRTGNASVEVDSVDAAISAVRALAARTGATIGNTAQRGGGDEVRSATIELRVPAARFDLLVGGLAPLGRLEHLDVHAQDVGEEYVDIAARVANARRLEERLVRLLATRTGRLEDVLAVERELARVREEIERHEGRLRFLRTRAAVSTLSVTVHEAAPIVASHPGAHPVRDALVEAWRRFVATTTGIIVLLGALLPVALVAIATWFGARALRRRWIALHPGQF